MSDQPFYITAKNLASFAVQKTCRRCLWHQLKLKWKIPFQIFPGALMTMDAYTKRVVATHVEEVGTPIWLRELGTILNALDYPKRGSFKLVLPDKNAVISGEVDAAFEIDVPADKRQVLLVDYKTARWTQAQQDFMPLYQAQLNIYADIWENLFPTNEARHLAIIYCQPITEDAHGKVDDIGFRLGFANKVVQVDRMLGWTQILLEEAMMLHGQDTPPSGVADCDNCKIVDKFMKFGESYRKAVAV
jgi:hypothetical protein